MEREGGRLGFYILQSGLQTSVEELNSSMCHDIHGHSYILFIPQNFHLRQRAGRHEAHGISQMYVNMLDLEL